jgi:hypothetical protein
MGSALTVKCQASHRNTPLDNNITISSSVGLRSNIRANFQHQQTEYVYPNRLVLLLLHWVMIKYVGLLRRVTS